MSRIDALLADLEGEGTVDSRGGFTLDRDKAREKMRQFQLADPRGYLLQFIRAAHCLGATRIDIEIDADDMHMHFDGDPFSQTDFDELYDALFGRADDPTVAARRHLALGLNAALGLDPRRIVVTSGAARLHAAPGVDDDWGALDPPIEGTRIHARDRFRFSNVFRFFRGLSDSLPEAALVRSRCGFSPVAITVNGAPLGPQREQLQASTRAFVEVASGAAWAYGGPTLPGERGTVHIIAGGISICSLPVAGADGFRGVAGSPHIRTDVSQGDVVRDQALDVLLDLVRAARRQALTQLIEAGDADAFLDAEVAVADWETLDQSHGPALAHALRQRPAGRTAAGATVRVADLPPSDPIECVRDLHPARCAALGVDLPLRFQRMLYLPRDADPAPIAAARLVDRTPDLVIWLDREARRQDFRRRLAAPHLGEVDAWVREPIVADGWRGELAIAAQGGVPRVEWILDGCLLTSQAVDLRVPGVRVALEGPITPTDDFTDLVRDAAFAEGAALIGAALHRAIGRLSDDPEQLRVKHRWITLGTGAEPALLTAQRLGGAEAAHSLSWLRALPTSDDPLADAPIFEVVHGAPRSLRALAERIRAGKKIEHVGPNTQRLPISTPVVIADRADRDLLAEAFGQVNLRSGRTRLERARRRLDFEAQPPRKPNLDFDRAGIGARYAFEGGIIGLRLQAGRTARGLRYETLVQPFVGGRPVAPVDLRLPLPSLVAAIEVGDLPLDDDFKALRDPPLAQMGARLAPQIDGLFRPGVDAVAARQMLRALIDLVVPTAAHRDAWQRWADPTAYLRLLREGWKAGPEAIAKGLEARVTPDAADGPADPATEALLEPFFAAAGTLSERLCAAFPHLTGAPTIRRLDGSDLSLRALQAAIVAEGLILHASRASVIPDAFGGVALKTEHAQLERLGRLFGDAAIQRATAWKATHALERAIAAAAPDPGGLDPARVLGTVPLPGGELGLQVPFDPDAPSRIDVVVDGHLVEALELRPAVPVLGSIRPSGEVRLVLNKGGRLGVDDLTRVRILDAARRAVDAALRAAAREPPSPDRTRHLVAALQAIARGKGRRREIEGDRDLRALAEVPLFKTLGGALVSLLDVIDHRERRHPVSVTEVGDVPAPRDPDHLVLHLDHHTWSALDTIFGRALDPYAEALAARASAEAFLAKPQQPLALADALLVEPVEEDGIRGLIGWGGAWDDLQVLRDGRPLGVTPLRLGLGPLNAIIDDPEAPPTPEWDDVAETPRLRRLRRICAGGIPALAARLSDAHPEAARELLFALIRCAFPTPAWVSLHRWAHATHQPHTAEDLYRDALRAIYQGTPRVLARIVERAPVSASALLEGVRRPSGAGVDASIRAAFGGEWPLAGDPSVDPLDRLVLQLGPLSQIAAVEDGRGQGLSLAELSVRARIAFDDRPTAVRCAPPERALLSALLGHRTAEAIEAADAERRQTHAREFALESARRQREAAEAERQATEARIQAAAAAARRTAEEARRARQLEADARARAEAQARAAAEAAAAVAPPEPPPPITDPVEVLLSRILSILHAIQADHPRLLADANLARLAAVDLGPLAQADDHKFVINIEHPTARAAISGDPIGIAMVTSAAYTALNLWLDAITDAHEVRFVALLADQAAALGLGP